MKLAEPSENNVIGPSGHRSAAEEYYTYKLRQERLKALAIKKAGTTEVAKEFGDYGDLATHLSEREELVLQVLNRLVKLSDLSPEYLHLKSLVGEDTREGIAEKLADMYLRKKTVEQKLKLYINERDVEKQVKAAQAASAKARANALGFS